MPMGFDQFDNAARVTRLDVGRAIPRRRFSAPRLARVVAGLVGDAEVAARCRETARRLAPADGLVRAGDAVEEAWARHVGRTGS